MGAAHRLPDSATQPSLSPDGHVLVFIRGPETFISDGQVYLKFLPDGQPIQLTHDDRPKLSPVFSPDGSRIAYTGLENFNWNTYQIPVTGGESKLMLPNASGLTWVDSQQMMLLPALRPLSTHSLSGRSSGICIECRCRDLHKVSVAQTCATTCHSEERATRNPLLDDSIFVICPALRRLSIGAQLLQRLLRFGRKRSMRQDL